MKKLIVSLFFLAAVLQIWAQDFRCSISLNSQKISGTNYEKFNALQQELYKFVNDRKWCQYTLKMDERIECSILINLESQSGDVYKGTMQLQLQRPVFKSNYKTSVLNFQDKYIQFNYADGDPLEYAEGSNLSQLTSLIAFYLNLFLAVDFNTFSLNGGAPYFAKCQDILNLNQSAVEPGWKSFETGQSNRYWLMENFTNASYSRFHDFLYQYHRLGLDIMSESPDMGRAAILEALRLLQQVNQQRSALYLMTILVQTKQQEIIEIFREGSPSERQQAIQIMKQIDPSNASKYDAINQQQN
ncbi:MAG: DUF4835 family protein [Bacteroidetes bacterium]|nr:DUF4835 family protein [Bacteroidota bacterium]MCL2303560.1 DUF4835 family protein [Lentimicrobiaceae bacterium]